MKNKMGIAGVGPILAGAGMISVFISACLDSKWHGSFLIFQDLLFNRLVAILLVIPGIILWLSSVWYVARYFPQGRLITKGPFAMFLNPLYASFILFIAPAPAFWLNSWIYFIPSAVMFILLKVYGIREEQ